MRAALGAVREVAALSAELRASVPVEDDLRLSAMALWPVLDASDPAALTQQLVGAMLYVGDGAAAVCRIQRDQLTGWQTGRSSMVPHHFDAHIATGSFARG
jgi:hypothetical protein